MQNLLRALGDRRIALQDGKQSQRGFTLVELLVVVIIIGILAGIAIPVFLNQREAAWRAEVESDLKNAALAIETNAVNNNGEYAADFDEADLVPPVFTESTAASVFDVTVAADGRSFTITGDHPELTPVATYTSTTSAITWAP
ncbi:type IV pilus assembly protein PilA [Agrococcus sp. UYP10]|uniref:type IV pilin protein n=1 Tax=Agrococcus sp. UYP10 TaxID=1756355 RepID=UPI003391BD21